jgi:hypothetical protein
MKHVFTLAVAAVVFGLSISSAQAVTFTKQECLDLGGNYQNFKKKGYQTCEYSNFQNHTSTVGENKDWQFRLMTTTKLFSNAEATVQEKMVHCWNPMGEEQPVASQECVELYQQYLSYL